MVGLDGFQEPTSLDIQKIISKGFDNWRKSGGVLMSGSLQMRRRTCLLASTCARLLREIQSFCGIPRSSF